MQICGTIHLNVSVIAVSRPREQRRGEAVKPPAVQDRRDAVPATDPGG